MKVVKHFILWLDLTERERSGVYLLCTRQGESGRVRTDECNGLGSKVSHSDPETRAVSLTDAILLQTFDEI